jgi:pimeloyl-ACP methyl ester carboxylesterase
MVAIVVLLVGILVALAGRLGVHLRPIWQGLNLAVRLPRHRAALAAMCTPPKTPSPNEAATLPIHITKWGEIGPRVWMIHGGVQGGLGGGPATFREQKDLEGQGWRLLVPDRPGFGESPTRGPDDMEGDAAWLSEALQDGDHLIGHSFGGAVALLAAARRPSAVRSLILVEPALMALLFGSKEMRANKDVRADLLRMGEAWLSARSPAEYGLALARDLGGVPHRAVDGMIPDERVAGTIGCAFLQARLANANVLRKAAKAVADAGVPVLVVTGGWSPTFEAVGAIAAKLTSGRQTIIRSPNHFVQLVAAKAFNTTADQFMRRRS